MSSEENKQQGDFVDTASSQFFTCQPFVLTKAEYARDESNAQSLEQQMARIREVLTASAELMKRLESNEQLLRYVQEVEQQLAVLRARSSNELDNAKLSFEKNFSSLERELAAFKKNWQIAKEMAESEMEESIASFKEECLKDNKGLTKLFSSASNEIKSKVGGLMQEIKDSKKMRGDSTNKLMSLIEESRARLDGMVQSDRKRRAEYQRIVLGLLDRTVDQGQRILRKIC